jgi:hypothetical protein
MLEVLTGNIVKSSNKNYFTNYLLCIIIVMYYNDKIKSDRQIILKNNYDKDECLDI